MDFGLSAKMCIKLNAYTVKLKRDGEVRFSDQAKSSESKLPRKASRANYIGACTDNRHRWSRRGS